MFVKQRHAQVSVLRLQRSLGDTPEFNFLLTSTNFSYLELALPHYIFFFPDLRNAATGPREKTQAGFFLFPLKMMHLLLNHYRKTNYIKLVGLNFHELGQAELILQCYLSPSSFFKATAAPESFVYPVLFVQEHQMAEK